MNLSAGRLHNFSGVATRGEYQGCQIDVEVASPDIVIFYISGKPAGSLYDVSWDASATDDEGVIEWLEEFGLLAEAKRYIMER